MTYRTALVALGAACALLTTAACDKPEDDSVPPVVTTTAASPTPDRTSSRTAWPEPVSPSAGNPTSARPDGSDEPKSPDSGLDACDKIMDNIRNSKLPLPVNENAAYYTAFKKKFTDSRFNDVKAAGEKFLDEYTAAIKAGGKDPDANDLSDSATDLVKACQRRM